MLYYNPLASKQNREKLSVQKFYSFIAGVVDTGDYPFVKIRNGANRVLRAIGVKEKKIL
jgi:hypothetical protein